VADERLRALVDGLTVLESGDADRGWQAHARFTPIPLPEAPSCSQQ
jgi:hypothetical protein